MTTNQKPLREQKVLKKEEQAVVKQKTWNTEKSEEATEVKMKRQAASQG